MDGTLKIIIGMLAMFLLISNVSALQYFQYNYFPSNSNYSSRMEAQLGYSTFEKPIAPNFHFNFGNSLLLLISPTLFQAGFISAIPSSSIIPEDSIENGKPLEFYYLFSVYVDDWNLKNPSYKVNYCNITINYLSYLSNYSTALYSNTFASTLYNSKYFVRLNKGDLSNAQVDCYFDSTNRTIEIPANLDVVTPSWDCKECQWYNWYKDYIQIDKARNLGTYTSSIWGYIKDLVNINIEVFYIFFWILMIEILIAVIGLILFGVYFIVLWIRSISR